MEPRRRDGRAAWRSWASRRRSGRCARSTACRCAPRRTRWSPWPGRAAAASRRCSSSCAGCRRPDAGTVRSPPAALMPQRDGLLPWLSALDNAGLALRVGGVSRRRGARGGARALRRVRARGLRAGAAGELSRRHAPARRLPAHAAGRAAGAVPRRAVRRARRADAAADAGLAGRRAGRRASTSRSRRRRSRSSSLHFAAVMVRDLLCSSCSTRYEIGELINVCTRCGMPLLVQYDLSPNPALRDEIRTRRADDVAVSRSASGR